MKGGGTFKSKPSVLYPFWNPALYFPAPVLESKPQARKSSSQSWSCVQPPHGLGMGPYSVGITVNRTDMVWLPWSSHLVGEITLKKALFKYQDCTMVLNIDNVNKGVEQRQLEEVRELWGNLALVMVNVQSRGSWGYIPLTQMGISGRQPESEKDASYSCVQRF